MLAQRVRLGLSPDLQAEPLCVRPVIMLGEPIHPEALHRLLVVQERLLARDVGYDDLEVWSVDQTVPCVTVIAPGSASHRHGLWSRVPEER